MDSTRKPTSSNPRKGANILSQLIFYWLAPIFYHGMNDGLTQSDITKCLKADRSGDLGDKLEREWKIELDNADKKKRKPLLRNALYRTFKWPVLSDGIYYFIFSMFKVLIPVILAQLLIQFQPPPITNSVSSQLIQSNSSDIAETIQRNVRSIESINDTDRLNSNQLIENIERDVNKSGRQNGPDTLDNKLNDINYFSVSELFEYAWNDQYCLATALILCIFISCIVIHNSEFRQRMVGARMRIACCSLIYRKTMRLSKKSAGETPAGYLINLLSNDVSRLDFATIFAHYIWILPVQSVLVCYLIWREVGLAAFVGVVGLLLKTVPVQSGLSKLSAVYRIRVAKKTDDRVSIMNELIQGIQVIKMYAWEKSFNNVVAEARRQEVQQIRYASYIRGINLSTMVFTERSTLFITLLACILLGQQINASIVFSLATFFNGLQLTAAIMYPLALSFAAEGLVSVKRLEDYLLKEEKQTTTGLKKYSVEANPKICVDLKNVSASWDTGYTKRKTLEEITLSVPVGKLCAIIGPVGAGKSSFLQMLLGELPIVDGQAKINGAVSYGSQEPWLFKGTIRNNILFGEAYDRKRYGDVIKCCALLTDFEQLPQGDKTIVGERGVSLSGGQRARISLARAVYKSANVYLFDDPLSAVDAHVGKHLFEEVIGPTGKLAKDNVTRILVTHQIHFLKEADIIVILENGKISKSGTFTELINSNLDFARLLERPKEKETGEEYENDELPIEIEEEIPFIDDAVIPYRQKSSSPSKSQTSKMSGSQVLSTEDITEDEDNEEAQEEGGLRFRVWKKYFLAGGTAIKLLYVLIVLITSQVVVSGADYFVTYWTRKEHDRGSNEHVEYTEMEYLIMYGVLIIGVILFTVWRGWLFFNICMHASKILHNRMFKVLLQVPMRFFDTNPSGRILNRFSKDMGAIDERLPTAMMDAIQILLVMSGILIMISIMNPIMIIVLLVAVIIDFCILKLYMRSGQDLKRLEGINRSPVFSHLSASLNGISTIRASNLETQVCNEFDDLQDVHSATWHLAVAANSALGLWLDIVSASFITCVTFSFIIMNENTFSGNVGLAISQALILTGMVQYGLKQSAECFQHMTSVERVLQYIDLEEEKSPSKTAPGGWPSKGQIEFRNMSLRYDFNDEVPVLKNLNFIINASWKVGVVGRTGAGKSSLIGALFRLAPIEGGIYIDDIETGTISLENLRSSISIIPQDPVLFSATIRYNLDPFGRYSDDQIWRALEDVELKKQIGALDYMVTEGGHNFSVGQRQLICLARAILRNNKILVLDEATANVDPQTDVLIQRTIRVKFKDCTVITVAHRLHTVMDSDRILVMDAGRMKEFDWPHLLLQNQTGILRGMIDATGPQESESLKRIAADTFKKFVAETIP